MSHRRRVLAQPAGPIADDLLFFDLIGQKKRNLIPW